jgi:hypothetical protein
VVLDHHAHVGRMLAEMADHLLAAVTDHDDDLARIYFAGRCQHVIEHGPAANPVQHLREGGFHPRARTSGKDDDGCRMAQTHVAVLLGSCSPGQPGSASRSPVTRHYA